MRADMHAFLHRACALTIITLCMIGLDGVSAKQPKHCLKGSEGKGFGLYSGPFLPCMVAEDGLFVQGEAQQRWGYVEVRPGANLFWWLYYTTHSDGYMNRPWLIWLEGGPGDSATVLANFGAIGPSDAEGNARNTSWVNSASVLFIDSPAGVGFSYFDDNATVPNTTEDTTADLIELYKAFTNSYTEFKELPLYIFGHSYGGRATAALAYFMRQAQDRGELESNLVGIGMGNAWVSPPDSTLGVPDLFLHMGYVGKERYEELMALARDIADRMRATVATGEEDPALFDAYWQLVAATSAVDLYNFLRFTPAPSNHEDLIYSVIKEQLGIIPDDVPESNLPCCNGLYRHDVFRDAYGWADKVLKMGDIQVAIYQGHLDILCQTKGAMDWVDRFTWDGMEEYRKQPFTPVDVPDTPPVIDMYVRAYNQLKFYTIVGSGHYVTIDKPDIALHMLNRVIDDIDQGTK